MEIYLVGGAVRDTLLGIPVNERDWVVVGSSPEEMIELGYKQVGSDFPVFLHPNTREEYALARTERKSGTGHKGFSFNTERNVTLEEDLKRRDLTINAIAKSTKGEYIDPFNGRKDLENKILRKVSESFGEDPLRVLRVARFSSKLKHLDFSVDRETLEEMKTVVNSGELKSLSKERIWKETYKAINEPNPEEYFKILLETEAIFELEMNVEIDLDLLKEISLEISEPELRWAFLAVNSKCNLDGLNTAFGIPKKIRELSLVLEKLVHFDSHHISEVKSRDVLNLILEVDGLRRNKRFIDALKILKSIRKKTETTGGALVSWDAISNLLLSVKPSSIELKEKEIIKDIRQQHLIIIDKELEKIG